MLYVCISFIRYKLKIIQFDPYYSMAYSIARTLVIVLYMNISIIIVSLYHGFSNLAKKVEVICTLIVVAYSLYQAGLYYFNENWDYQKNFLGHKISLRSIIISSAVDLAAWLLYQSYNMIRYPDKMFLTSRVTINWIEK